MLAVPAARAQTDSEQVFLLHKHSALVNTDFTHQSIIIRLL